MRTESSRCLLASYAAALVAFTSFERASAQLMPGVKVCSPSDSARTLASERKDLNQRLPAGYRNFAIVPAHNNDLRIIVDAAIITEPEGKRVADIWQAVLAAYYRDCGYSGLSVRFVTTSGNELLTVNIST